MAVAFLFHLKFPLYNTITEIHIPNVKILILRCQQTISNSSVKKSITVFLATLSSTMLLNHKNSPSRVS